MTLRSGLRPLSLVVAVGLALLLAGCGDDDDGGESSSTTSAPPTSESGPPEDAIQRDDGLFETPEGGVFADPPEFAANATDCEGADIAFPSPPDSVDRAEEAGVAVDSVEWLTFHVHSHVSVFVDGDQRAVPGDLGVDNESHRIAALHTHDCTGQIHMEAEEEVEFFLGQLLALWGVDLDEEGAEVFHNGDEVEDPAALTLAECDEVAIVIGEPPAAIPSDGQEFC